MKHSLMTFGEKYTEKDMKEFFDLLPIEDGRFPSQYCSDMLTGKLEDEAQPEAEATPPEE